VQEVPRKINIIITINKKKLFFIDFPLSFEFNNIEPLHAT
jgi:hypothetical protein